MPEIISRTNWSLEEESRLAVLQKRQNSHWGGFLTKAGMLVNCFGIFVTVCTGGAAFPALIAACTIGSVLAVVGLGVASYEYAHKKEVIMLEHKKAMCNITHPLSSINTIDSIASASESDMMLDVSDTIDSIDLTQERKKVDVFKNQLATLGMWMGVAAGICACVTGIIFFSIGIMSSLPMYLVIGVAAVAAGTLIASISGREIFLKWDKELTLLSSESRKTIDNMQDNRLHNTAEYSISPLATQPSASHRVTELVSNTSESPKINEVVDTENHKEGAKWSAKVK